jgi:hypothetical protein
MTMAQSLTEGVHSHTVSFGVRASFSVALLTRLQLRMAFPDGGHILADSRRGFALVTSRTFPLQFRALSIREYLLFTDPSIDQDHARLPLQDPALSVSGGQGLVMLINGQRCINAFTDCENIALDDYQGESACRLGSHFSSERYAPER